MCACVDVCVCVCEREREIKRERERERERECVCVCVRERDIGAERAATLAELCKMRQGQRAGGTERHAELRSQVSGLTFGELPCGHLSGLHDP